MKKIVYREDIVEYRNFLSEKECDEIVSYLVSGNDGWQTTCFYNSAVMDIRYPWEKDDTLAINEDYFKELKSKMHVLAEDASGKKLRNLSMSAHKWEIGAYAGDHSDNSDLDGNPNAWQDNKFVTLLYLNNDYSGGHLTFKDHGLDIIPSKGSLIGFDPGFKNIHGVTEITSGIRYTLLLSWDYADLQYSPEQLKQMAEEKAGQAVIQEKQREEWAKGNA